MDRQTIIDILYKYNNAINPIDYNLFLAEMVNYDDSELEVFRKKTVFHLFFKDIVKQELTTEQKERLNEIKKLSDEEVIRQFLEMRVSRNSLPIKSPKFFQEYLHLEGRYTYLNIWDRKITYRLLPLKLLTDFELKEYWDEEIMWNASDKDLIEIFYDEVIKRLRKTKLKKLNEIEKGR